MSNIQSCSIVVPAGCPNDCKFCVAEMERGNFENRIEDPSDVLAEEDYLQRLRYVRDNGCDNVILTGNGEPMQNKEFLQRFAYWNEIIGSPFYKVEIQTSGTLLNNYNLEFLRNQIGINTISLSLSSLDSKMNQKYNQTPDSLFFNIENLCKMIKEYNFNLRLSLNLTDEFNGWRRDKLFNYIKSLKADQVTFRKLYKSGQGLKQDKWIEEHKAWDGLADHLSEYIKEKGEAIEILPFGATRYSINGLSTVVDDDCMSEKAKQSLKYLVLYPNCHLYARWNDKGSLDY